MSIEMVRVTDLKPGDQIDLETDPYANDCVDGADCQDDDCPRLRDDTYSYEYAIVLGGEQETPSCYRLDIEHETGEHSIGFPTDHEVCRVSLADIIANAQEG